MTTFPGYDYVETLDLDPGGDPYTYYVAGVWTKDGDYYLGTDSGCSCYLPFELYSANDLVGPLSEKEAIAELVNLYNDSVHSDPELDPNDYPTFESLMKIQVWNY